MSARLRNRRWVVGMATLLCLASTPAAAAGVIKGDLFCDEGAGDPELTIVYANGEFTSFAQAMSGLDRLARSVPGHLGMARAKIEFGLAFNYDEHFSDKIAHVTRLLGEPVAIDGLRRLAHDQGLSTEVLDYVQGVVADAVGLAVPGADKFLAPDTDLWTHVQMYQDYVRRGRKVVVVGHGVGSLYTNRALFFIENQRAAKYVAAVGVGSPDREILGPAHGCGVTGCYVTRDDDLIAGFVPQALSANVEGDPDIGGITHHDFVTAYMGDPFVRQAILDRIKSQVRGLGTPRARIGDGPVKASLQWAQGKDLDLHVYEADRIAHVSYDATEGQVGTLDKDSRVGGAESENYFARCARLQPGEYEFGASYYAGDGPVTAHLALKIGAETYHLERALPAPVGDDGYFDSEPLAFLTLERAGDGWFYFELYGGEGSSTPAP